MKLKTIVAALLVLAAGTGAAHAQLNWWDGAKVEAPQVTLRVEGGLNLSKFTRVDRWSDFKAGFNIGVMAERPILNSLSAKAGIFYSLKGASGKNDGGFGGDIKNSWAPGYLEIPVMASYRLPVTEAYRAQFDLGLYFAYGLGGKQTLKYSGSKVASDSDTKNPVFTKSLKRFDMGMRFGPEFVFNDRLAVAINYEFSLVNISNMGGEVGLGNLMFNVSYPFYAF